MLFFNYDDLRANYIDINAIGIQLGVSMYLFEANLDKVVTA